MNKADVIDALAKKADLTKKQAAAVLDEILAIFSQVFYKQDTLTLPGFGSFGVKKRAARSGRNPTTGEAIKIPAAKVPFVRVSSKIKDKLNNRTTIKQATFKKKR